MVINSCKGLKIPNRLLNGVKPSTRIFQRYMANSLSNIKKTVVRVDDVLLTGLDDNQNLETLEKVFEIFKRSGAKINVKKCVFFASNVKYLGFIIRMETDPGKVKAIMEKPEQINVKQLQRVSGGMHYYARFVQNMAVIAKPLYKLLEKENELKWTDLENSTFVKLKRMVGCAPTLCLYDVGLPHVLACDASSYGVGAVISHKLKDNTEKPIASASKTLDRHQINYSQAEKEGLAVIFALKNLINIYLEENL